MVELSTPLKRLVRSCSLPVALEAMGERWSFLILLASFNGIGHFEDYQSRLGIARNILSNRLGRLVERGILERCPCADDRRKVAYRLTDKGLALLPTLIALRQWGERWEAKYPASPVLVDLRDGEPVEQIEVRAHDGRTLGAGDLGWLETDEQAVSPLCQAHRAPAPHPAKPVAAVAAIEL